MSAHLRPLMLAACVALLATTACFVGPGIATYAPAHDAEGLRLTIRTPGDFAMGELVDVRDSAVVVLAQGDLVLVPLSLITDLRFAHQGAIPRRGKALTAEHRTILRRVSRFPQGMSPELETRFLAELGRPAMRVMTR